MATAGERRWRAGGVWFRCANGDARRQRRGAARARRSAVCVCNARRAGAKKTHQSPLTQPTHHHRHRHHQQPSRTPPPARPPGESGRQRGRDRRSLCQQALEPPPPPPPPPRPPPRRGPPRQHSTTPQRQQQRQQQQCRVQRSVTLPAFKRGCHVVTRQLLQEVPEVAEFEVGLANLFIQHTSASLTVNENASPDVPLDLNVRFVARCLSPLLSHLGPAAHDVERLGGLALRVSARFFRPAFKYVSNPSFKTATTSRAHKPCHQHTTLHNHNHIHHNNTTGRARPHRAGGPPLPPRRRGPRRHAGARQGVAHGAVADGARAVSFFAHALLPLPLQSLRRRRAAAVGWSAAGLLPALHDLLCSPPPHPNPSCIRPHKHPSITSPPPPPAPPNINNTIDPDRARPPRARHVAGHLPQRAPQRGRAPHHCRDAAGAEARRRAVVRAVPVMSASGLKAVVVPCKLSRAAPKRCFWGGWRRRWWSWLRGAQPRCAQRARAAVDGRVTANLRP